MQGLYNLQIVVRSRQGTVDCNAFLSLESSRLFALLEFCNRESAATNLSTRLQMHSYSLGAQYRLTSQTLGRQRCKNIDSPYILRDDTGKNTIVQEYTYYIVTQ